MVTTDLFQTTVIKGIHSEKIRIKLVYNDTCRHSQLAKIFWKGQYLWLIIPTVAQYKSQLNQEANICDWGLIPKTAEVAARFQEETAAL